MVKKEWRPAGERTPEDVQVKELAGKLNVSALTALTLFNRGCTEFEIASKFLSAAGDPFFDPFLLNDMNKAVDRIIKAVDEKKKIVIYGDYDVDGVTSVSVLYRYLSGIGARVGYHVPDRESEGYGVNKDTLKTLCESGNSLIVTVDTGITAIDEVEFASSLGMDVVITDHHECREDIPKAVAVINPKRHDSDYPFKELAGVGVAFKLICAIEMTRCPEEDRNSVSERMAEKYIDLVAIGTVADVMPLISENRIIVSKGLEKLNRAPCVPAAALCDRSGVKGQISASTISFTLAPRINAAGRMESAETAVRLFLSDEYEAAYELAGVLCEDNRVRQEEENRITSAVAEKIGENDDRTIIVLADDGWSSGIIGIVASRLTERYGVPSIMIALDGELGKGSGRSIPGIDLVGLLGECSDQLEKYGGHSLAAGLTVRRDKLDDFIKVINNKISEKYGALPTPVITYDAEVSVNDINITQVRQIGLLEPFGVANPSPLFRINECEITGITPLSRGKHTKLTVRKDGKDCTALFFGRSPESLGVDISERVDLLFTMSENEFRGNVSAQILVRCLKLSDEDGLETARKRFADIMSGAAFGQNESILPSREDIAYVYRYIRAVYETSGGRVNVRRLCALSCGKIGIIKARLSVEILADAGIINIKNSENDEIYSIKINQLSGKTDIEKTPLYLKLMSQERHILQ